MGIFIKSLLGPLLGGKGLNLNNAIIAGGITLVLLSAMALGFVLIGKIEDGATGRVQAKIATANDTLRSKSEAEAAAQRAKEAVELSRARERVADLEQRLAEQDEDPIVFDADLVRSLNQ